jgi:hypothetical protein
MFFGGSGFLGLSYDSAPRPPPPVSMLPLFLCFPVGRRSSLLTGKGGGVGLDPNHMTARKPGPLKIVHHSLPRPLSTSGSFSNDL